MISLLVPAALAAPLYVLDDAEIGTWARIALPAEDVAAIAALPDGGRWSGHGPYARGVALDRIGDLRVGGTVTATSDDGAPVSCAVTGFGVLEHVYDDGEGAADPGANGCAERGIWARLDCRGTAPGPVALRGGRAPVTWTPGPAGAADLAAVGDGLGAALDAVLADAPGPVAREVTVQRWTSGDRALLLVSVEAWAGERPVGCGRDGWARHAWGLFDAESLAPVFPLVPRDDDQLPFAVLDGDRDGRPDVFVRDLSGDVLLSATGATLITAPRAVCVCTC